MAERVGNGQQQAIGSGQRGSQPACGHQPGNHIRQARNFGGGQHDDVATDAHFIELQDAIHVDIGDGQQTRIHLVPRSDPGRQGIERGAHQHIEHLKLDQHSQRWCREIEQHNEKQRPRHRLPGLAHIGGGVVTGQHMGQRSRAHHQAKQQSKKIAAGHIEFGLLFRGAIRVSAVLLCLGRHAVERLLLGLQLMQSLLPLPHRHLRVTGQPGQPFFSCNLLGLRGFGGPEQGDLGFSFRSLHGEGPHGVGQHVMQMVGLILKNLAHSLLVGVVGEADLLRRDFFKLHAIHNLRQRNARLLHAEPDHWQQVGHDDDDVLGHLCPGHSPHAAQKRANQNPAQAEKDTQLERHTHEAGSDQAHPVNLGHHIGERAQDGSGHTQKPRQIAAIPFPQKIRNGELAEFAQIGRQKQGNQTKPARPPHDEGQPVVPGEVQRACQPQKRGR